MNTVSLSRRRAVAILCALAAALGVVAPLVRHASAARADVAGFSGFAPVARSGSTMSVGISGDGSTLTLTDGGAQEATAAYLREPQPVRAFTASFVYQATKFGGTGGAGGDGFAFVLENDPRGVKALGNPGEALGYGGAVTNSAAIAFELYGASGIAVAKDGVRGLYSDTVPVDFRSGDPIQVHLDCDGSTVEVALKDTVSGATFEDLYAIDLSSLGESGAAYVGLTGSSGDATALQTIRDFHFAPRAEAPVNRRRQVALPEPKRFGSLISYVDPLIGTAGGGNTYPGAVAPFGMVQFSPDTSSHGIGYDYGQHQIEGFSLTHMSGVGCDDFGDVFLAATAGPIKTAPADYTSPYSHRHETAEPGYYQVELTKSHIDAELTASLHDGLARFTFPAGQPGNVLVPISHTLTTTDRASITVASDHEITGQVTSKSFCGSNQSYTVYFVMRLDEPFATFGTFTADRPLPGGHTASQNTMEPPVGAYVTYPASDRKRVVTARIGISFVDLDGARRNLDAEIGDRSFDDVRHRAAAEWERALSVIDTHAPSHAVGATPENDQRVVFYTALYHCLLMPNVASDVDGRYTGFDNMIHQMPKGHELYANYSGWDIYRTEAPLLALIAPDRMQDMCESIVLMYQQGGWIDRWPQANTYTNVMCGSPLTTVIATAWNYGLRDFDITAGYEGMYKDATQPAPGGKPYAGEANVAWMDKVGYIPDDKEGYGSVSQTEEDCIAYSSLALVAQSLGKTEDAAFLTKRALNYKNLFDPQTKFLRPKLADGTWLSPFDPTKERGYVEGSGWHYRWLAPQDVAGLIALFGGDKAFNTELDSFFAYPKPEWNNRYYNPYNEPDLQAPFLYDYSGAPWKTQAVVRKTLADVYKTTPDGIPGNDDCGTMSAWCVFGMLGLYPTDPARPAFELCSPVFPKATIRLAKPYAGKTLTLTADAAAYPYIHAVTWNGAPVDRPWVTQTDLVKGGVLNFSLTDAPDKTWGAAESRRPPSLSK